MAAVAVELAPIATLPFAPFATWLPEPIATLPSASAAAPDCRCGGAADCGAATSRRDGTLVGAGGASNSDRSSARRLCAAAAGVARETAASVTSVTARADRYRSTRGRLRAATAGAAGAAGRPLAGGASSADCGRPTSRSIGARATGAGGAAGGAVVSVTARADRGGATSPMRRHPCRRGRWSNLAAVVRDCRQRRRQRHSRRHCRKRGGRAGTYAEAFAGRGAVARFGSASNGCAASHWNRSLQIPLMSRCLGWPRRSAFRAIQIKDWIGAIQAWRPGRQKYLKSGREGRLFVKISGRCGVRDAEDEGGPAGCRPEIERSAKPWRPCSAGPAPGRGLLRDRSHGRRPGSSA